MKHEKIKKLLPLYIDDGLTENEEKILENHLENCKECQKKLKEYKQNHNLLSSVEKEKAPENLSKLILNKINKEKTDEYKENIQNNNNHTNKILSKIKNLFTRTVKVPAGLIALASVILIVSIAGLPGFLLDNQNSSNNNFQAEKQYSHFQSQTYDQNNQITPNTQSIDNSRMKLAGNSSQQNKNLNSNSSNIEIEQKIIKRANLTIESNNIDQIEDKIIELVKNNKGYISDSRNWLDQNKRKYYSFNLKIPAENFNQILEQLSDEEYGKIISRSISSQDVTEQYMDLDIRLDNLLAQEDRYKKLLNQTKKVKEILDIENELNRIRTEIERLQGRKKYLDNQINYSTINVKIRQPEPISSGTPGIIKAIKNAINKMLEQFYEIIILIGTIIPYFVILAIGYLLYKKFKHN